MKKLLTLLIIAVISLSACSHKKKKEGPQLKAEEVYNQGMDNMQERKFKSAIESFETLEREYPYSKWATRGQVMAAYAFYKQEKYDDVVNTVDRFAQLHPGNEDIAYSYYLKALAYYNQIADVRRDQEMTLKAKDALKEVVARFPATDYASDAQLKLDLVEDHLAGKELEIGRYYLDQGNTLAAINRYKKVVEQYQTTSHVAEALYRLTEAYVALGVVGEAQKYAAVLGYNYPNSKWYDYAYTLLKGNIPPTAREAAKQEKQSFVHKTLRKVGVE